MNINETNETSVQYLTFMLENENFALEINKVREVLDYTTITRVPRMPDFLRGVINLRGNVVPVIDLRLKLDMSAIKKTVDTCIVIVEIMIDGQITQVGALADSVKEVINLDPASISPAPRIGTKLKNEFIKGMGQQDGRFLIILDIDRVLSEEELDLVKSSGDMEILKQKKGMENISEHIKPVKPVIDLDAPDNDFIGRDFTSLDEVVAE
ncbi:Chemotaxis protein [Desulfonema limicola]|uniref:Chemotaxis protein n=1 Tax=Desulfonema limicola TaxID=45656 RepID=A0A975B9V6_9BACT|nr:chemotaxis protein CheW [Desulfonema limicola]QTA81601.1 Chemotaxis protein [Desulfonema limicola]